MEEQKESPKHRPVTTPEARAVHAVDATSLAGMRDTIGEVLRILLTRRWHFLIPFCVVMVLATTASQYLPRTYMASADFERVDDDVLKNLPIRGTAGLFLPFRETLARDIRSPEVVQEVVVQLGLAEGLPRDSDGQLTPAGLRQCRALGAQLVSYATAGLVRSTDHKDTVRLVYSGPDAHLGPKLLEAIRDAYIRWTQVRITQKLQENKDYFESEARKWQKQVDELEYSKSAREIASPNLDPTNADVIFIKLTGLKNEEHELRRQQATLRTKLQKTKEYLASIAVTSSTGLAPNSGAALMLPPPTLNPRVQALQDEIKRVETQIEKLKITRQMTDRHPEIAELHQLRERYERLLKEASTTEATTANQGLDGGGPGDADQPAGDIWRAEKMRTEMAVASYGDELERTNQSLERVLADTKALEEARARVPEARQEYRQLQERLAHLRKDHLLYAQAAQQFGVLLAADEDARGIRFVKLGNAAGSVRPSRPQAKSILMLALVAAIGAGMFFVLLAELLDRSFHTAKQVTQSLGLSILESIDEIVTSADRARRFRRQFILAPAAAAVLLGAAGISTSLAYLSLQSPATYERVIAKPRQMWQSLAGTPAEPRQEQTEAFAAAPGSEVQTPLVKVDQPGEDRLATTLTGPSSPAFPPTTP